MLSLLRATTAALPGLCDLEKASFPLSKFRWRHNKHLTKFLRRENETTCEKSVFKTVRAIKHFFKKLIILLKSLLPLQ